MSESRVRIIVIGGGGRHLADAPAVLEGVGHHVAVLPDAEAALGDASPSGADLVLVDSSAEGVDALALCRALRERSALATSHVLVAISADARPGAADVLDAGADDYLIAPFDEAALLTGVSLGLKAGELRASEARLRALVANVPGAIYRGAWDADWRMELISHEIERISGYPSSDFIGNARRTFASVIHPEDRAAVERGVAEATERGAPFSLEYRIVRADGEVRWVHERGQVVAGCGREWLDGVIFDITERRRAEEVVRRSEVERARMEELRASRARIVDAADASRRRLERDLHDGAQQQLVAAALELRLARSRLEGGAHAAAAELLEHGLGELEQATRELRELARGIHPAVLTDRGLVAALTALAGRAPLPVRLEIEHSRPASSQAEAAVYFVVAEALTNVARYAEATRATVHIADGEGCTVDATVHDDGVGGADPRHGSGLQGLIDRVEALDGTLELESPPEGGTLLRAAIPCAPREQLPGDAPPVGPASPDRTHRDGRASSPRARGAGVPGA